jgi:ferrochelatase
MTSTPLGVLLLNFGGPETLADVRPFLFNLFSDPNIIRIRNRWLRCGIAWIISTARQKKSRNLYRQIGGGSPLRRLTCLQAEALERALSLQNCSARIYVGMRYWKPTIDDAVIRIKNDGIRRLVVLPLFPQYSITTSGSCLHHFNSAAERTGLADRTEIRQAEAWFLEPLYLEAMADSIRDAQRRFSSLKASEIRLVYSAHSIPARCVEEGDPYQKQTEATASAIDNLLGRDFPSTLAYQSKVGPVKWLGPATADVLAELGRQGTRKVLMAPVSFVSDHIETLQEIDIAYRKLASKSGIDEFQRAAALNATLKFIDALAAICSRIAKA